MVLGVCNCLLPVGDPGILGSSAVFDNSKLARMVQGIAEDDAHCRKANSQNRDCNFGLDQFKNNNGGNYGRQKRELGSPGKGKVEGNEKSEK